ncbi:MAG: hypothetical protein IT364_20290 [Candidatus Hydrogenedentes bacterium]|nr:hypothetical protein [Candidatus Hydrogenedentota bacterium]
MRTRMLAGVILCLGFCFAAADAPEEARRNAVQAQEALQRSKRVLDAYLLRLDPVTGLLPRRGGENTWYVRDSAADLYPFLVMAAYYTERPTYEGTMHAILRNEMLHGNRAGRLPDNVLPGGAGFEHADVDMDRILFGSCEYVKDGLLPLTELLGHHAWYARMRGIVDDIIANAPYDTPYGKIPSISAEVNGELLQALARLAFLTRDPKYIDQAVRIGDFYFLEVIPKSNGLPAHLWDLEQGKPKSDVFVLSDHGNEIVGGLSELVLYLKETGHPAYERFSKPMSGVVATLLDCGLNEDGVWYLSISLATHQPVDARHAHCWGYLFNGVYTTYLITGEERFKDATLRALKTVTTKSTYLDDPEGSGRKYGSNAYSDALESAIVFKNRFPDAVDWSVLDTCFERFLRRQRDDGIIEDWYGDGNYVRTALMYAFMKSQGAWIEPWREDVRLGAVPTDNGILLTLESEQPWEGRIRFDVPRHRDYFNLPINYPRLNEWPEWYTVEMDRLYAVEVNGEKMTRSGGELVQGLTVAAGTRSGILLTVRRTD